MMGEYLLLAALAALLPAEAVKAQSPLWGVGRAKDGDSLLVGETEVRLFGIDAPEFDQACTRGGKSWSCGGAAADQLMSLVTGKDIECVSMGVDEHGRTLGRCTVAGTDINRAMVSSGYAIAYRRYSSDYIGAEESAKTAKLGLWSGSFETPEHFRRGGRVTVRRGHSGRPASQSRSTHWAARAQSNCNIKGNRNRKGQWIYHVPGMPYYDETRPEEIFCTEAEAQAAGYRRAIVK